MAVQSILRNTPEESSAYSARAERALRLFAEHCDHIQCIGPKTFSVPSCSGRGRYLVKYGGFEEGCNCPDHAFHPGRACKHLLCVGIAHAARRSGIKETRILDVAVGDGIAYAAKRRAKCAGCGNACRRGELVEVEESLTYVSGDLLCPECWHGSDAVVL